MFKFKVNDKLTGSGCNVANDKLSERGCNMCPMTNSLEVVAMCPMINSLEVVAMWPMTNSLELILDIIYNQNLKKKYCYLNNIINFVLNIKIG